jgi:glycosyltransferase involved in cell wall biosynthesis
VSAAPAPAAELITIIVAAYNEQRTVRAVIDRLLSIDLPVAREILIVDDGSTDGTHEVLAAAIRENLPITVLRAERNAGKGSAIGSAWRMRAGRSSPFRMPISSSIRSNCRRWWPPSSAATAMWSTARAF